MAEKTGGMEAAAGVSSMICCYLRHPCSRPRYQKYKFCAQHILEDTSSPFTSCEYLSRTSGRKCPNPAIRSERVNNSHAFCEEHLRELIVKEQHQKQKRKLRKKRKSGKFVEKNSAFAKRQKLINRLARYNKDVSRPPDNGSSDSEVEDVHRPITDDWPLDKEDLGTNADWDDFDPVNNEVYEPLRYADVLTPEEVVATAQSKLIRLQSLYIEQFKRLFHLLKERRRQYLHERKKELAGTSAQAHDDEEFIVADEVYALASYRRRTGVEALLRKRQLKRRQEADGNTSNFKSSTAISRCSHTSNHTRCKESCLPYTKYCTLHILSDPHQQLYTKCHAKNCPKSVCILTSRVHESPLKIEDAKPDEIYYCILHNPLPPLEFKFPELKKEEEMEVDVETPEEAASDALLVRNDEEPSNIHNKFSEANKSTHKQDAAQLPIAQDSVDHVDQQKMEAKAMVFNTTDASSELCNTSPVESIGDQSVTKGSEASHDGSELFKIKEPLGEEAKLGAATHEQYLSESCRKPADDGNYLPVTAEAIDCGNAESNCPQPNERISRAEMGCKDLEDGTTESNVDRLIVSSSPFPAKTTLSARNVEGETPHNMRGALQVTSVQPTESLALPADDATLAVGAASRTDGEEAASSEGAKAAGQEDNARSPLPHNSHKDVDTEHSIQGEPPDSESPRLPPIGSPLYLSHRSDRKPSSAEEELAVVSLLSLCTGHPSDDNAHSSSTEQE